MTLVCILPSIRTWVNNKMEIIPGPVYNEKCEVIGEDPDGWLLEGYQTLEGYEKRWFYELSDKSFDQLMNELATKKLEPA